MAALNTEWLSNSLDIIARSTGLSFEKGDPSVKEITVNFSNVDNNSLAWVTSTFDGANVTKKLALTVNMKYYDDLRDSDMAKEMTNYTKNSILMQAAQAMLSQANQSASNVLSLLQ